ncbi:hypothetical protein SKAU_G00366540 [Synaphobranchus kaupii]|uniref:Uncharacterized protein n=1 Tax=Synaphobranchus kaupii TaxID=118154 RepID=A0A9Q1EF71_SYNKA|nr:hypothetical protein SKAU_G00366540 [Synaphobranchus kaupii]
MYKLKEDQANVVKELKNGGEGSSEDDRDNESTDDDGSDKASDKEDRAPHDESMYSVLVPQAMPPGTWVQNLSYLLTNSNWLYKETVRREAVCVLLGMKSTLLHKKNVRHLDEWVSANLDPMSKYNFELTDRLSVALIASYKRAMSRMDDWCCKLEQLIAGDQGKRSPPLSKSKPERPEPKARTSPSHSSEDDDDKRYYKPDKWLSDEEDDSDNIEDEAVSTSMKLICKEDLSETETPRNSQEARVERPRSSDSKGKSKRVLKHTEARRKTSEAKHEETKKSPVPEQLARKQKSKARKRPRPSSCDSDSPAAALPVKKQKKETLESCPSHTQKYKPLVSEKDKEKEGRKLGSSDSEDEDKREQGPHRTAGVSKKNKKLKTPVCPKTKNAIDRYFVKK